MKIHAANLLKLALWVLLFCAGFPLSAKGPSGYYIYIQPVSGTGKSPEDNALFTGFLAGEVTANNHKIAENQETANFILTPELSRMSGQKPSDQSYLLHVTLTDKRTNTVIAEQKLIYSSPEEAGGLLKVMMGNVFSAITGTGTAKPKDKPKDNTDWRSQWLYLGVSAFWSPRIYSGNVQSTKMLNFGAGVSAELQFLDFLSAETGFALVPEQIRTPYGNSVDKLDLILEIPLLVKYKYILKLGTYHLFKPYGGIHANFPLYGDARPLLFSVCAGLQYGIKAGPGMFFIDTRFSTDIGNYRVNKATDNTPIPFSNKFQVDVGIGYKFGFFSRQ